MYRGGQPHTKGDDDGSTTRVGTADSGGSVDDPQRIRRGCEARQASRFAEGGSLCYPETQTFDFQWEGEDPYGEFEGEGENGQG